MTTVADDIRQVVARRTSVPDNLGGVDDLSETEARQLVLSMMTAAAQAQRELTAYLNQLAELSAQAGANNVERGAAVGISKQAAAKRWGDPRASRLVAAQR